MKSIRPHLIPFVGYLDLGLYREANDELEKLPNKIKPHPEVLLARMQLLMSMGRWNDAAILGAYLANAWPEEREFWCKAVVCLNELKRTEEATRTLWMTLFGRSPGKLGFNQRDEEREGEVHSKPASRMTGRKTTDLTDQMISSGKEKLNMAWLLETRMKFTVEASHAFVLADSKGCLVWANPAFGQLCGYEIEELIGRKPGSVLQGPDTKPTAVEQFRKSIRSGSSCCVTLLNYHKTGRPYYVRIELKPMRDAEDQLLYYGAVQIDVTQEKRQEAELRNQALDIFYGKSEP